MTDEKTNLPAPFNPDAVGFEGSLEFPVAPPPPEVGKPILRIDHGKGDWSTGQGTWHYGSLSLPKIDALVFLAVREYRMLYARDYSVDPEAPLVCLSWDGVTAYGRGGRDPMAAVSLRNCCELVGGGRRKKICPAAKGQGDEWLCRPNNELFCMIMFQDEWVPAFFDCKGRSIKPTLQAYNIAVSREKATKNKDPRYFWMFSPQLVKADSKRDGYVPVWGAPSLVSSEPDRDFLAAWVRDNAAAMWRQQFEDHQALAKSIGQDDAEPEEEIKDAEVSGGGTRHTPENMPF